jgi:ubiquinone/menaquinone biosynthesis C-methylase UbiE
MQGEIKERYTRESTSCDSLGCGSNMPFLLIRAGDQILDLGCGRGEETMQAAALSGETGLAVGLDLTEAMVETAAQNAASRGVKNVRFMVGDIENLPFEDGSFDRVISNCVINHARDKGKVYAEIFRVLKPGGHFVVSDAVTKYPLPSDVKNDPAAWAQCFGGAVTEKEYGDSIASAGFLKPEILKRREYLKNGYDFISLTIRAAKPYTVLR